MSTNENHVNFLDMPEDIFYEVFRYLDYSDIYFLVRNVCKTLEHYVHRYIQLGGVFMLVGGGCSFGEVFEKRYSSEIFYAFKRCSSEALYAFKQNVKVASVCSRPVPVLPNPLPTYVIGDLEMHTYIEIASFGTVINGKIIAGYYCKEHWEEKMPVRLWKKVRYRRPSQRSGYRLVPYLFEYDKSKKLWLPILPSESEPISYQKDVTCNLSFCGTEDSIFVRLSINKGGEYGLGEEFDYKIACFRFKNLVEDPIHDIKDSDISQLKYSMRYLESPTQKLETKSHPDVSQLTQFNDELERPSEEFDGTIHECCLTYIGDNEVILLGYEESNEKSMQKLWLRIVKTNEFDVIWGKISFNSVEDVIRKPICFKLQNHIYILESFRGIPNSGTLNLKCGKYDLLEKEYHAFEHILPCPIKSIHAVVTDPGETFAVILGLIEVPDPTDVGGRCHIHKPRLMIFTEKDGFQQKLKDTDLTHFVINAGIGFASSGTALLKIK